MNNKNPKAVSAREAWSAQFPSKAEPTATKAPSPTLAAEWRKAFTLPTPSEVSAPSAPVAAKTQTAPIHDPEEMKRLVTSRINGNRSARDSQYALLEKWIAAGCPHDPAIYGQLEEMNLMNKFSYCLLG